MISALSFFRFGRRLGRLDSRKVKGRPEIFIIIRVPRLGGRRVSLVMFSIAFSLNVSKL